MGKRLVEVQMQNIELEQDMAILRKKFRDLLTYKGLDGSGGAAKAQNVDQSGDISQLLLQVKDLNDEVAELKLDNEKLRKSLG